MHCSRASTLPSYFPQLFTLCACQNREPKLSIWAYHPSCQPHSSLPQGLSMPGRPDLTGSSCLHLLLSGHLVYPDLKDLQQALPFPLLGVSSFYFPVNVLFIFYLPVTSSVRSAWTTSKVIQHMVGSHKAPRICHCWCYVLPNWTTVGRQTVPRVRGQDFLAHQCFPRCLST